MNSLYVHIPKTAGNSITPALSLTRVSYKKPAAKFFTGHITLVHLKPKDFPPVAAEFAATAYKYTCCRNPYDRAVSIWGYSARWKMTFADYMDHIEEFLEKDDKANWRAFGLQSQWFDGIEYDHVMRLENLPEEIERMQQRLGVPVEPLHRLNRSDHGPWEEQYCSRSTDTVQRIYKDDFELLGYPL